MEAEGSRRRRWLDAQHAQRGPAAFSAEDAQTGTGIRVPEHLFAGEHWGTDRTGLVKYATKLLHHQRKAMSAPQPDKPKKICENILIEKKRYKIELTEAYDELHGRLYAHPHAL